MQDAPSRVTGWGVDRRPEDRPGVPREFTPPHPIGSATVSEPDPRLTGPVAVRDPRRPVTSVHGTRNPPRGLSGVARRIAYRIPAYKARRWMLLVLADRIDVVEHNAGRFLMVAGGAFAIVAGVFAVRRLRDA